MKGKKKKRVKCQTVLGMDGRPWVTQCQNPGMEAPRALWRSQVAR